MIGEMDQQTDGNKENIYGYVELAHLNHSFCFMPALVELPKFLCVKSYSEISNRQKVVIIKDKT